MVAVILDTNIWIGFVAKDNPPGILEQLIEKNGREIILLSNEIILDEWLRNKPKTIKDVSNAIKSHSNSARKIAEFLSGDEKQQLTDILDKYNSTEEERIRVATERVEGTEKLIRSCAMTPITNEMKLKVVDWALKKRAPFKVKGSSVGDALILLSAVEFWESRSIGVTDSIFVSWNHEEFSRLDDIDKIHEDLEELLKGANMTYTRNIAEAINLAPQLIEEINKYIDYQLDYWIEMEAEIAQGR